MHNSKNLRVAERARLLAIAVYRLTADFPSEERFGLAQQMRRAAVSIGCNIVEGSGRRGNREMLYFLHISLGSTNELAFQLQLAADLAFGVDELRNECGDSLEVLQRMLKRSNDRSNAATRRSAPDARSP